MSQTLLDEFPQTISWNKTPVQKLLREIRRPFSQMTSFFERCYLAPLSEFDRDAFTLKKLYREKTGKKLDLTNPKTLNEKIQWLKLYHRPPILTQLADKYAVRSYVTEKIGEEYLVPLLAVYDNVTQINFDDLPEKFILKTTQASGGNILCKDKSLLDIGETCSFLKKWLEVNVYDALKEWQYKNITPRIVCETLLERSDGKDLYDYKIFLFNGNPKFIQVNVGRESSLTPMFFDLNWERIPVKYPHYPNGTQISHSKPKQLEKMLELASRLSPNAPLVRADFYLHEENIYFGELTFSPESGIAAWEPEEYDRIFGDMLKLPMD